MDEKCSSFTVALCSPSTNTRHDIHTLWHLHTHNRHVGTERKPHSTLPVRDEKTTYYTIEERKQEIKCRNIELCCSSRTRKGSARIRIVEYHKVVISSICFSLNSYSFSRIISHDEFPNFRINNRLVLLLNNTWSNARVFTNFEVWNLIHRCCIKCEGWWWLTNNFYDLMLYDRKNSCQKNSLVPLDEAKWVLTWGTIYT